MNWLVENWDSINTIVNTVLLLLVAKNKKVKVTKL